MKSTMKSTNRTRTITAALLLAVISFTAIGGNSKTDTGNGHNYEKKNIITSAADENGMNIFSRIAAEINKSISNNRMILRLSGINLPNHSN
jgi:hypothetical protein